MIGIVDACPQCGMSLCRSVAPNLDAGLEPERAFAGPKTVRCPGLHCQAVVAIDGRPARRDAIQDTVH